MSFRRGKTLLLICCTVFALAVMAAPAFAQTCIQDEYNSFNGVSKTLSCTAKDVSVAGIAPGGISVFPGGGDKCLAGSTFSFTATFEIKTTSSKTRSNIGIFFGTGQANALTGTCSQAILSPPHQCVGDSAVTCGDTGSPTGYEELDQAINGETGPSSPGATAGCGDTTSADNTTLFGAGTQAATLEVDNVTCPLSGNTLSLPVCTGWFQPTTGMPVCESPGPSYPWVAAAVPGTTSKCSCSILSIPVQPITPMATVAKSCNIPPDTTAGKVSCDAGQEGHDVVYTVTITNTTPTGEGGIVIDQICDSAYGQIFPASGTCPAGTPGHTFVSGTTCPPAPIANGGSGSCTFTVSHGENLSVTDTATVTGHSGLVASSLFGPDNSNMVTVTSSDAPTTAKTTKGLEPGPQAACVTLRYDATVTNTSSADESVTLNSVGTLGTPGYVPALHDSRYGDITTTHGSASLDGSVTGTTCGASGQGTLSGSPGAGAFPHMLAPGTGTPPTSNGGSYTCQFDGVICSTPAVPLGPIVTTAGTCSTGDTGTPGNCTAGKPPATACTSNAQCNVTCAEGLQERDMVTANLTGDDPSPNADTITQTEHQFTANVCLVQSGQSQ